jgi:glycosyltransferase involved in cell wall biosynthesis
LPTNSDNRVIGIDASRMVGRVRTGTENYSDQIIRGLLADPAPWSWRLYFNGNASESGIEESDTLQLRDIPSPRLWTHLRLSRELLQSRPAGLFVPSHVVPLVHPPSVVTIHDLGYLHVPESHPARQRRMLDITTRWSARVARHIIVPSGRTRDDLVKFYGVPASKITVIHHGVHPRFAAARGQEDATFRERYRLTKPYVLAVGTIQPRKNLVVLAQAMKEVSPDHDLVIAGRRGWMADSVLSGLESAGLGSRLRILDYVPDDDLPALYREADVFVQPSHFEGFGMPVLEAMASGTVVITSGGSSLAEISGDAAIYFEQDNAHDLADHIRIAIDDNGLQESFQERGIAWSGAFSWEHAARKTRTVLQETLMDVG